MPAPPGDAEFTEFVHAAWPGLYRTAYLMVGDHQLAMACVLSCAHAAARGSAAYALKRCDSRARDRGHHLYSAEAS